MLKVHHIPGTRSLRVCWLLEELGEPYEVVPFQANPDAFRAPEFLRVSPLGRLPALEDGDVAMGESGAICDYLLDTLGDGRLMPAAKGADLAAYRQWMHGAETVALTVGTYHWLLRFVPEELRNPDLLELAKGRSLQALGGIERAVEARDFIAGDTFTAADIMVGYTLIYAGYFDLVSERDLPNAVRYVEALKTRDAFARADAKGRA